MENMEMTALMTDFKSLIVLAWNIPLTLLYVICNLVLSVYYILFPRQELTIKIASAAPPVALALHTESIGAGKNGEINVLARVSIVSKNSGKCLYDQYVKPILPVTDYRTSTTGIRQDQLVDAASFKAVQERVSRIIRGSVLIGYGVEKHLRLLGLRHPVENIRDVALYGAFRSVPHEMPSLEYLAKHCLSRMVPSDEDKCVKEARATMDLYLLVAKEWEWETIDP